MRISPDSGLGLFEENVASSFKNPQRYPHMRIFSVLNCLWLRAPPCVGWQFSYFHSPFSIPTPPWVVHLTFVSISILDPVAYNPKLQHPPPLLFQTRTQINGRAHFEHEVQSGSGKLNKRGAKESSDRLYKTITFSCTRASAVDREKHLKAFLSGSRRARPRR